MTAIEFLHYNITMSTDDNANINNSVTKFISLQQWWWVVVPGLGLPKYLESCAPGCLEICASKVLNGLISSWLEVSGLIIDAWADQIIAEPLNPKNS